MRRVLLSIAQSQQGISRLSDWNWPRKTLHHGGISPYFDTVRYASSFTLASSVLPPRRRARAAAEEVTLGELDAEDISFSEGLKQGISQALSRHRKLAKTDLVFTSYPPPGSKLYGKWQSLSVDHDRLVQESDINVSDSQGMRLVNQPEHEQDIQLWSCLLQFVHRRMGRDGVIMLWQSIFNRRRLYQVHGPLAQAFWSMILDAALSSEAFLRDVVDYAEWMREAHHVQWPRLYTTVISYMVENARRSVLLRWHITLMSSFGPDEADFVDLIRKFITNPDRRVQNSLKLLYTYSAYRKLYDLLIPYLYTKGHANLAMQWRILLCNFNDTPLSLTSRPFLRFMSAYYPNTSLREDEKTVAGLVSDESETSVRPTDSPSEIPITGQNLSYLINRVHGETFGIQEKPYNDRLGAKWFASSWVGLDFAINVIYTMGMKGIGPLSLQSIALREGNAQGVLHRIEQLEQLKISLPRTNYVRAIRQYAAVGDNESLLELLQSDIHPDLFDDESAQEELLASCVRADDWKTYRLVLRTRSAVLSGIVATASDRVLESCVRQGNGPMTLQVLQEMSAHKVGLAPITSHILSSFILQNLSPHVTPGESREHIDLQISLCRQLAASRFPPAVEVWQTILYRLGREHRLVDLERLSLDILRIFADHARSDQPMWTSHVADVPALLQSDSSYPYFQRLPRDLPIRHDKHPLRQIFDKKLQNSIVRWGFMYTRYEAEAEATAVSLLTTPVPVSSSSSFLSKEHDALHPAKFHFARGIRLLAMLRDRGLFTLAPTVQKQATIRLLDLYRGGGRGDYEWPQGNPRIAQLRRKTRLSLAEAKNLCDAAWGNGEIVPSLLDLERRIELEEFGDEMGSLQKKMERINEGR